MPLNDQHGSYIELNTFLKIKGIADSGGDAKIIIRSNKIKVNGEIDTRLRKKQRDKDVVEFEKKKFVVNMEEF